MPEYAASLNGKAWSVLVFPLSYIAEWCVFLILIKYKEKYPDMNWITIAHRCGYFDQMHLIRDFKTFAGFTPGMLKEKDIETSVCFQKLVD